MGKAKKKRCYLCEGEVSKIAASLNNKLIGKNISYCYCITCLSEYLDVSIEDLLEKAEEFKKQGCTLF